MMAQINSAPVSDKCWHKGNVRLRRGNADLTNADAGRIRRHILRIWPKRHGGPNRSLASVIRSRRAILAQFLVARAVGDERQPGTRWDGNRDQVPVAPLGCTLWRH